MSNWKLVVTNPSHGSKEYPLDPSRRYTVGRANSDVDLGFEPLASRRHATLEWTAAGWKLIDDLSANGTKVNGKPVNVANMEPGIVAQVGTTSLTVVASGIATHASPTTTSGYPAQVSSPPKPIAPVVAPVHPSAAPSGKAQPPQPAVAAPAVPMPAAAAPQRRPMPVKSGSNTGMLVGVGVTILVVIIGIAVAMNSGGGNYQEEQPTVSSGTMPQTPLAPKRADPSTRSVSQWLDSIEADTDADRALSEIEQLQAVSGRKMNDGERARFDRLRKTVEAKVRTGAVVMQRRMNQDVKELLAREECMKAWLVIDEVERNRSQRGPGFMKISEDAGLSLDIAARRNDVTTLSASLYQLILKDAATSEQAGMVNDAIQKMKTIQEKLVLSPDLQVFVASRLRQLETNPNIVQARPSNRTTPRAGARAPWDPMGHKSLNDPTNPDSPYYDPNAAKVAGETGAQPGATPGTDMPPAPVKRDLPPNPLFPHGRLTQEEFMYGVIDTIRSGIAENKLKNRQLRRGKQVFQILEATESGIRMKDAETGQVRMFDWAFFSVAEYDSLLSRVEGENADNLLGLALIALERREDPEARKILVRMLALDAARKPGADILLANYEQRGSLPEGGYVSFEGSLLHPEAVALVMFERKIAGLLATVEKGLGARDKSTAREKCEEAFKEIIGMGPEAVAPTVRLLQKLKSDLIATAESATGLSGDTKALDALFAELEKRRKHALELIFDLQEWPYPYGPKNAEVTAEVMKRVAAVREIWNDPASVKGATNPKFDEVIRKIRDLNIRLDAVDPAFAHHEPSVDADVDYLQQIANERLNIRKYGKSRGDKTKLAGWWKIMDENERIQKEFEGKPEAPEATAWEQLRITNDYRMMMGRHPLKMNFKLFWAARHHSQWCVEHNGGRISHDSPGGPRGNNVPERCAFEGYTSGTGENIHMNSGGPSPQSAHDSWLSSSGHHRNILSENWTVMGNGVFQTIWTQNFGNADEGTGNQQSKGGK